MGKFIIYNLWDSCPVRNAWLAADNLKLVVFFLCLKSCKLLWRGKHCCVMWFWSLLQHQLHRLMFKVPLELRLAPLQPCTAHPGVLAKGFEAASCSGKDQGVESSASAWLRKAANTPARKLLRAEPALCCLLLSTSFAWTTANIAKLSRNTGIAWAIQVCGDGQQGAK